MNGSLVADTDGGKGVTGLAGGLSDGTLAVTIAGFFAWVTAQPGALKQTATTKPIVAALVIVQIAVFSDLNLIEPSMIRTYSI